MVLAGIWFVGTNGTSVGTTVTKPPGICCWKRPNAELQMMLVARVGRSAFEPGSVLAELVPVRFDAMLSCWLGGTIVGWRATPSPRGFGPATVLPFRQPHEPLAYEPHWPPLSKSEFRGLWRPHVLGSSGRSERVLMPKSVSRGLFTPPAGTGLFNKADADESESQLVTDLVSTLLGSFSICSA